MRREQKIPVTDRELAFSLFDRYLRDWLEPLDLDRWMIELHWDEAEDAWASCEAEPKYRKALVKMNPTRFADEAFTPLQIESVAVHELTHCLIWPGHNELANPQIPEPVASYFEEIAADGLAHALMMAKYKGAPEIKTLWQGYRVRRPK